MQGRYPATAGHARTHLPQVVIVCTTTIEGQEGLFDDYDDASPLLSLGMVTFEVENRPC